MNNFLVIILAFLLLLCSYSCQPDLLRNSNLDTLPMLKIDIEHKHMLLLLKKQQEALREGLLVTKKNDYVPAKIRYQEQELPAVVRLKGDWLDHLKGNKWSLRIKLENETTLLGMQRFSIQHPRTRSWLDEWVFHQLLQQEGILTPQYTFVQIQLNGEYKGIYALEEHFDKLLLEKQGRREAPILKYVEDGFWQAQQDGLDHRVNLTPYLPIFEAAPIQAFQKGHTLQNPVLHQNFLFAKQKMEDLRLARESPLDLLHTTDMARLYALADIAQAYHSFRWHNFRFYYNPFTTRLEPVVYDAYGSKGPYRWFPKPWLGYYDQRHSKVYYREEYLVFNLFNIPSFRQSYFQYLKEFSDSAYLNAFFEKKSTEIQRLERAIQKEYLFYRYDWQFLKKETAKIREQLLDYDQKYPPFEFRIYSPNYDSCRSTYPLKDISLKTCIEEGKSSNSILSLSNYYCQEITIIATGPKRSKPLHQLSQPLTLPIFDMHHPPPPITKIPIPRGDHYVFYSVSDKPFRYHKKISSWPCDTTFSFFHHRKLQIDSSIFNQKEDTLYLTKGNYQFTSLQVIPTDIPLVVEAGVTIDLTSGGGVLIQGPLIMRGQKKLPIRIFSSDGLSSGWQVIEASGTAQFNWVYFKGLQALQKNGYWLSGGVTIYQTNLTMTHCRFNHFNSEDALNIVNCKKGVLSDLKFQNCHDDALDIDFSNLKISNCTFEHIGGDALDCSGSQIEASHLEIESVQDKGISLGEDSRVTLQHISISQTRVGLAVKDATQATVKELHLKDCDFGVTVFNKKNYFSSANLDLHFLHCSNTPCLHIESGQEVRLNGQVQHATDSIGYLPALLY